MRGERIRRWACLSAFLAGGCGASTLPGDAGGEGCAAGDVDHDGHESLECGGDDCDDTNPDASPSVEEDEGWAVEAVADEGASPDLAVNAADVAFLAFSGPTGVAYARREGGTWSVGQDVDALASGPPRVALDSADTVHLMWSRTNPDSTQTIRHGKDPNGEGALEVDGFPVDLMTSQPTYAIALDSEDVVHGVYVHGGNPVSEFREAVLGPEGWSDTLLFDFETVGVGFPQWPLSIAMDGADRLHLAYIAWDDFCDDPGPLRAFYSTGATGEWMTEPISDIASARVSLALGPDEVPMAVLNGWSYETDKCGRTSTGLRVGPRQESGWALESREDALEVAASAIAIDRAGTTVLAFIRRDAGLFCQVHSGSDWSPDLVDPRAHGAVSIVSGTRFVHLAYERVGPSGVTGIAYARHSIPDGIDNDCDGEVW